MTDTTTLLPNPLISIDPGRMSGEPCFTGTRVPVTTLFDHLMAGDALDVFLLDFPSVSREHAEAVLQYAHKALIARESTVKQAAE